jgi:maltooligosyltrehalose trehalohydrolase
MDAHQKPHDRRFAYGAEVHDDGTDFRVFAPKRARAEVVFEPTGATLPSPSLELIQEPCGIFRGFARGIRAGTRYRLRLDGTCLLPDPASRFQPEGPHGPSEVIDPRAFAWHDAGWKGPSRKGAVVYEMHLGTFTEEGSYRAAIRELSALRALGITLLELMPLADFPGRFGWGYDGVNLYAPTRLYGRPDDLRAFVDAAHALEMGVLLDAVYNHLGPSGNYLREFSDDYFTTRHTTAWGEALDFAYSPNARAFFADNGAYWIDEFHLDGLRLDATQAIHDDSPVHIVQEIALRARAKAGDRTTLFFAETETRSASLVRSLDEGGLGLDALWNDDFHHVARVVATGRREAYYAPYRGSAQELVSAMTRGFLFQGQRGAEDTPMRGEPASDLPHAAFTHFLENHDHVATSARGARLHQLSRPSVYRALVALLLLGPATPLLFQGQEFNASSPFVYFADLEPELSHKVAEGRRRFLATFSSLSSDEVQARLPEPGALTTFLQCKLDHSERSRNADTISLYTDLLRLRRSDPVFSAADSLRIEGATLGPRALVLRYSDRSGEARLLVASLDDALDASALAEPLLAPPAGASWERLLSTEDLAYGGEGSPPAKAGLVLPCAAALVFAGRAVQRSHGCRTPRSPLRSRSPRECRQGNRHPPSRRARPHWTKSQVFGVSRSVPRVAPRATCRTRVAGGCPGAENARSSSACQNLRSMKVY